MTSRSPALERLDALVGEWTLEGSVATDPSFTARGWTSFEWLAGGFFLVQRWGNEVPEFPDGIAIIGMDSATDALAQHYYDSRGVQRVYGMSLSDGVWRLWRQGEDFSQRFTGAFSDDGATIAGRWEISRDGATWQHDFDLTFAKTP